MDECVCCEGPFDVRLVNALPWCVLCRDAAHHIDYELDRLPGYRDAIDGQALARGVQR
jgi:hypothetical protein